MRYWIPRIGLVVLGAYCTLWGCGGNQGVINGSSGVPVVSSVAIAPKTASLAAGKTLAYSANATGISWSVSSGGAGGTIDTAGVYTAPAKTGTDTIVATASGGQSGQATVTVVTAITITPAVAVVSVTKQTTFQAATVPANQSVTWSVQPGGAGGTIDKATGVYTAPAAAGSGADTIVATTGEQTAQSSVAVQAASGTISVQ